MTDPNVQTPPTLLIHNAEIVNEQSRFRGYVAVNGQFISAVGSGDPPAGLLSSAAEVIDARGGMLMPGAIDTHVHFRDPGLTRKGDFESESAEAVAGGVTSVVDMPNTNPATVSIDALEAKMAHAAEAMHCNYAFFIGATNSNLDELLRADYTRVAGVKLFLGSSTGNMLVDRRSMLEDLFSRVDALIAVHAESEAVIAANRSRISAMYPEGEVPLRCHPEIRSRRACVEAARQAADLALAHRRRLHLLHISTADELALLTPEHRRYVTTETAPHYLHFSDADYDRLGTRVKCNPAIKSDADRRELRKALADGRIDTIATDHAPHLLAEKQGDALKATSGMPGIRFSLVEMLEVAREEGYDPSLVVEKMAHAPARIFHIDRRGYIRPGYYADLVVVEPLSEPWTAADSPDLGKCGWTPYAGSQFHNRVALTAVNGKIVMRDGKLTDRRPSAAMPLRFDPPHEER